MQPLVAHNALASIIFTAVFGCWLVFEIGLSSSRRPGGTVKRQDRGSAALIFGSMAVAFILMDSIASHLTGAAIAAPRWVVFGAGIALAIAGFALRLSAIRALGRSFIPVVGTRPDQDVVESGPYRLIRHPSYSGALVIMLGAALTFTNWLSLLAIVPPFIAYVYRGSVEESALKDQLGNTYREYCRRTKRFIPFVY